MAVEAEAFVGQTAGAPPPKICCGARGFMEVVAPEAAARRDVAARQTTTYDADEKGI